MIGSELRTRVGTRPGVALIELGTDQGYLTSTSIGRLTEAIADADARHKEVVVFYSEGEDLCLGRRPQPGDAWSRLRQLEEIVRFNRALNTFPGVTIVMARGKAKGFGFGLCVGADVCIVDDDATFQFDEVEHGLAPLVVVEYLAEAFNWRQIVSMTALGDVLTADACTTLGFRRAARGRVVDDVVAVVETFDRKRTAATRLIKSYFRGLPAGMRSPNFGYDAIARLDLWIDEQKRQSSNGQGT